MVFSFESIVDLMFFASKEVLGKRDEQDYSVAKKDDGTLITSVDIEVNKILIDGIKSIFGKDSKIVSEENAQGENAIALKEDHFLIDPIDGTYSFVRGSEFAINVAYMQNNIPVQGAIAIPTRGQVFYTTNVPSRVYKATNTSVEVIKKKQTASIVSKNHYKMIVNNRSVLKNNILFSSEDIQRIFLEWGFNFDTILKGIASIKYCMLLEDMGDLVCSLGRLMSWDLAAPCALLKAVDFKMVNEYGKDVTFDNQKPNNIVFAYQNELFADFIEKVF